jgi:hypothetical protein
LAKFKKIIFTESSIKELEKRYWYGKITFIR